MHMMKTWNTITLYDSDAPYINVAASGFFFYSSLPKEDVTSAGGFDDLFKQQ